MKKSFCIAAIVLWAGSFAYGATNCQTFISYVGHDVNNPISNVCAKTGPDNGGGTANQVLFTATTALASNFCVWIAIPGVDFSEASVGREVCTNTISTSHSLLVDGFNPNFTYGFYDFACTTGCLGDTPASRVDGHISSSPFGTSTANLYTFTVPDTTSGLFDWRAYMVGPHLHWMRGWQGLIPINGYKTSGPPTASNPNRTIIADVTIDGHSCLPLTLGGTTCQNFTVQPTCGYDMINSSGTHNYRQSMFSSGARTGQDFCNANSLDYELTQIRLYVNNSVVLGLHTVCAVILQSDQTTGAILGSTQTPCYDITVEALPTWTDVPPTSFTAITNLANWNSNLFGSDITTGHAFNGLIPQYYNFEVSNTTSPGIFNNDSGGPTIYTVNPWGFMTYRGADQVIFGAIDYLSYINTNNLDLAFIPSHTYTHGEFICTGGTGSCASGTNYILVVTDIAGCTASASLGSVSAPGTSYVNGTCHLGNVSNPSYLLRYAERAATQQQNLLLNAGNVSNHLVIQEWASFDNYQFCLRNGGCLDNSLGAIAIEYLLFPLEPCYPNCHGASQSQRVTFDAARQPFGMRSLPYNTEHYVSLWYRTGVKPLDNGVDEIDIREDMMIQSLNNLMEYSLHDGVNSLFACCISWTGFDNHLAVEGLHEICAAQKHFVGTCDAKIKKTFERLADWIYSNRFNLLGTNFSEPYNQWAAPFNDTTYNAIQTSLNGLGMMTYTILWGLKGDTCTLPTSGVSCKTAADQYAAHEFDRASNPSTGKEDSQAYRDWWMYFQMRMGLVDVYWIPKQPSANPNTTFPGLMEPYPEGTSPAKPTASPTSSGAVISFYTFGNAVSASIKYGTTAGTINTVGTCSPLSISTININNGLKIVNCTINGQAPSTTYYYGVSPCDAGGHCGYSEYDINLNNHPPFSYTTLAGPVVSIACVTNCTVTGTLPPGTVGVGYASTVRATGGTGPYSYTTLCTNFSGSICDVVVNNIAGLNLNVISPDGNETGTPLLTGSASVRITGCDINNNCGSKTYFVGIAAGSINPFATQGPGSFQGAGTLY